MGAAPTKELSLRGLEYQYRGVLITDCLRCDMLSWGTKREVPEPGLVLIFEITS